MFPINHNSGGARILAVKKRRDGRLQLGARPTQHGAGRALRRRHERIWQGREFEDAVMPLKSINELCNFLVGAAAVVETRTGVFCK